MLTIKNGATVEASSSSGELWNLPESIDDNGETQDKIVRAWGDGL